MNLIDLSLVKIGDPALYSILKLEILPGSNLEMQS